MKTLKNYIAEASLLDIEGTIEGGEKVIKDNIERWIKDNFRVDRLNISDNPNSDGKYEASATYANVKNTNITSLTNDMFVWKKVSRRFYCYGCKYLKSLEGAPKEVGGYFDCSYCTSLTSLEGAPDKVYGGFYCKNCLSLTSLEGAPNYVGGYFYCDDCLSLTSLEGAPKEIKGHFVCYGCKALKSIDLPATTKLKGEILK